MQVLVMQVLVMQVLVMQVLVMQVLEEKPMKRTLVVATFLCLASFVLTLTALGETYSNTPWPTCTIPTIGDPQGSPKACNEMSGPGSTAPNQEQCQSCCSKNCRNSSSQDFATCFNCCGQSTDSLCTAPVPGPNSVPPRSYWGTDPGPTHP